MIDASQLKEHMEIKGSDGKHIGTVDRIEGNRIKLTKSDAAAGGQHHYIDLVQIEKVQDGAAWAAKSADECKRLLQ